MTVEPETKNIGVRVQRRHPYQDPSRASTGVIMGMFTAPGPDGTRGRHPTHLRVLWDDGRQANVHPTALKEEPRGLRSAAEIAQLTHRAGALARAGASSKPVGPCEHHVVLWEGDGQPGYCETCGIEMVRIQPPRFESVKEADIWMEHAAKWRPLGGEVSPLPPLPPGNYTVTLEQFERLTGKPLTKSRRRTEEPSSFVHPSD